MANAHLFSAGVELPNQGLAPIVTVSSHLDDDDKIKLGADDAGVEERIAGDDAVVHEQAMPEGPTVSRWEEWAYVGDRLFFSYRWRLTRVVVPVLQW